MDTKKILGIVFSALFVALFGFVLTWGIINFNKVKDAMSGTELYTQEDLNNAYQDGYDTALTNKDEYDTLINGYRDNIISLNDTISQLNSQISSLNATNKDCNYQIENLTSTKSELESQVANLNEIKSNNEATIKELNVEIDRLEREIETLNVSEDDKDYTIQILNNQIENYKAHIVQLQNTNNLNLETISSLNSQISSLNSQISDLTLQVNNNSSNVTALNNKIAELEKSVAYYESYIANLETSDQCVATFEYDGSVYNIQIVKSGSTVSVLNPTSTDYKIFNYWTVDGEKVDLSTYTISVNTKFVANVTYKYAVTFTVNGEVYDSQIVVKNGFVNLPGNPTVDGYEFDGWSLNGVDVVSPNTIAITSNTTFDAVLTQKYTVTFVYEDNVVSTQSVRNGSCASDVIIANTDYITFNGWAYNGSIIDLSTFKITGSITLVADVTYAYRVRFMVDGVLYNAQTIVKNNYVILPNNPTKDGYEFDGWSINGVDIVDVENMAIDSDITYFAIFTQLFTVNFVYENDTVETQIIRNGEYCSNVLINDSTEKLFKGWIHEDKVVDVTTISITQNITFKALVSYLVQFSMNDTIIDSQYVDYGNTANYTGSTTVGDYNITGWTLFGGIVDDFSVIPVGEPITFIADVERVKITATANSSSAYSVTDNWSSAGVYIYRFKLTELRTDFGPNVNSAKIEISWSGLLGTTGTETVDSEHGCVGFFIDDDVAISCDPSNGGFSIYVYNKSYKSFEFSLVIYPYYQSGYSGL